MNEILKERLSDLNVPLIMDLPIGHGLPNMALPMGGKAILNGEMGTLILDNE